MGKSLIVLLFLMSSAVTWAGDIEQFVYAGQPEEILNLDSYTTETRYRDRVIYDTCYRNEPYEHRVCRDETRYRQECRTEPGRQVCRVVPGQRTCRRVNGRQVCRTTPSRRVCSTTPSRRICRNVPYNHRVCRNETRYRSVPYTCSRTVSEPYQVQIDHYASVKVVFENHSNENHDFKVTLDNNLNVAIEQENNTQTVAVLKDTQRSVSYGDLSSRVDVVFTIRFVRQNREQLLKNHIILNPNLRD